MKSKIIPAIIAGLLALACGPITINIGQPAPTSTPIIIDTPTMISLPDLMITSSLVSMVDINGNCLGGYELTAMLFNQGYAPAPDVIVEELMSGHLIYVGTLEPQHSMVLQFPASPNGRYRIMIDPQYQIMESDEANNIVTPPSPPATPPGYCLPNMIRTPTLVPDSHCDAAEEPIRLSGAPDRCHFVAADISTAEGAEKAVAPATEKGGGLEVLVNNAGITQDHIVLRMKDEEWAKVIDTNLGSIFRLSKAVLRGMTRARWGRIVNISSVVGSMGNAGQANYAASKAGMVGFTRALAREIASRAITVNCVSPATTETDATREWIQEQGEQIMRAYQPPPVMPSVSAGRIRCPSVP